MVGSHELDHVDLGGGGLLDQARPVVRAHGAVAAVRSGIGVTHDAFELALVSQLGPQAAVWRGGRRFGCGGWHLPFPFRGFA
jgi:hypothetical protein